MVIREDEAFLQLTARLGTPLYVYRLGTLTDKVEKIRRAFDFDQLVLLFATMANPNLEILRCLGTLSVGACVNSIPHLRLSLSAGIAPERIQYSATAISEGDMRGIIEAKVDVNLDSERQASRFVRSGLRRLGLRVNAASLVGRSSGDRIGIEAGKLQAVQSCVAQYVGSIAGLHVYIVTNFHRASEMIPTVEAFCRAAARISTLEYINIGGGVGVAYSDDDLDFDIEEYAGYVKDAFYRIPGARSGRVRLFFEPGRALSAGCGSFLATVTDVKELNGKKYVGTDASVAIFPRPMHYPDSPHRVRVLNRSGAPDLVESTIVGQTTFSGDVLGNQRLPSDVQEGDILVFDNAGAYCASMYSHFLGQHEPKYVIV